MIVANPGTHVRLPDFFSVLASITPLDVISRKGQVDPTTEIAVIDIRGIEKRELVECGLLLRNSGRTVVVCDTTRLPVDLIIQVHNFTVEAKKQGKAVRTELLFIEEAIEAVTDLPDLEKLV